MSERQIGYLIAVIVVGIGIMWVSTVGWVRHAVL